MLFYRILRHFQNLSRVAAMRDEGMRPEAIQAELKMKPYPVRKLMEQSALLGSGRDRPQTGRAGRDRCPHEGHGHAARTRWSCSCASAGC